MEDWVELDGDFRGRMIVYSGGTEVCFLMRNQRDMYFSAGLLGKVRCMISHMLVRNWNFVF